MAFTYQGKSFVSVRDLIDDIYEIIFHELGGTTFCLDSLLVLYKENFYEDDEYDEEDESDEKEKQKERIETANKALDKAKDFMSFMEGYSEYIDALYIYMGYSYDEEPNIKMILK